MTHRVMSQAEFWKLLGVKPGGPGLVVKRSDGVVDIMFTPTPFGPRITHPCKPLSTLISRGLEVNL